MKNALKYLILTSILTLQLSAADSLKLVKPNGGEVFEAGTSTDILWEGIPDTSSVEIKFSSDNGKSWNVLFDSADGLSEQWNVPDIESDSCLVAVSQKYTLSQNEPIIEWERSYGGSFPDGASSITETYDMGYIVIGGSQSIDGDISNPLGDSDSWIVKIDSDGELEWEKSFGGNDIDEATSITNTTDKGVIIAGYSTPIDGVNAYSERLFDCWIVKIDSSGELEWEKSYGGSDTESANSIFQTLDSGFIVACSSKSSDRDITNSKGGSDYWIVKINQNGDIEWEKSYGGSSNDIPKSIIQTNDGGYIVVGSSKSTDGDISNPLGYSDYWIVKLNSLGELVWEMSYGGSHVDNANSIIQTNDGRYIVVGSSKSTDGDISNPLGYSDYWIVKLNSIGELVWEKSVGGSNFDDANSIIQTNDDGYIVAGTSRSSDGDISNPLGNSDYWIVKLNSIGELVWEKSVGGSNFDDANSIIQTNDNGYIVAGLSKSNDLQVSNPKGDYDYWIVKISNTSKRYNESDTSDAVFSIVKPDEPDPDTTYNFDYFVYDNNQSNSANAVVILEEDTDITIEVYDVLGKRIVELYSGLAKEGRNEYRIEYNNYQSGRYFVKLTTPTITKTEIIEVLR